MAAFVDDSYVRDLQARLDKHFSLMATVIIAGPGLGQTDECTAVIVHTHEGNQHDHNIDFTVADRPAHEVATNLIGQIVRWMQTTRQAS